MSYEKLWVKSYLSHFLKHSSDKTFETYSSTETLQDRDVEKHRNKENIKSNQSKLFYRNGFGFWKQGSKDLKRPT